MPTLSCSTRKFLCESAGCFLSNQRDHHIITCFFFFTNRFLKRITEQWDALNHVLIVKVRRKELGDRGQDVTLTSTASALQDCLPAVHTPCYLWMNSLHLPA